MNTFLHQAERQLSLSLCVLFSEMSSTEETSHKYPNTTPPPPFFFDRHRSRTSIFIIFILRNQAFAPQIFLVVLIWTQVKLKRKCIAGYAGQGNTKISFIDYIRLIFEVHLRFPLNCTFSPSFAFIQLQMNINCSSRSLPHRTFSLYATRRPQKGI